MSDQLTHEASLPSAEPVRRPWAVPAAQAAAIVVLCVGAGAVAGWLWERLWTPARGMVWQGQWNKGLLYLDQKTFAQLWSENAHQDVWSAVGIYTAIAAAAGLVCGLVAVFLLARNPLVTLTSLGVGGVAGGVVMGRLGMALGPDDPNELAKHAGNGVLLPDRLQLSGVNWHLNLFGWHLAPNLLYLTFPGVALLVLGVVFLTFDGSKRSVREPDAAAGQDRLVTTD